MVMASTRLMLDLLSRCPGTNVLVRGRGPPRGRGRGGASAGGGAGVGAGAGAHTPKARPRMTTLSSMASRKKRVISHRIWTQWGRASALGPAPLPAPSAPTDRPRPTLSATVAASDVLTVMDTTARAMPTSATTNTWGGKEDPGLGGGHTRGRLLPESLLWAQDCTI